MAEEPHKLTAKQERFCDEYVIDCNATQAAIRAGYSEKTAYSIGHENLSKPEIQKSIQFRIETMADRVGLTHHLILSTINNGLRGDVRKLFDEQGDLRDITDLDSATASALVGVEVTEHLVGGDDDKVLVRTKKYKFVDKTAMTNLALKHRGMLVEKTEVIHDVKEGGKLDAHLTSALDRAYGDQPS